MLSCAFSSAMLGIDGYVVRVETDSSPGVPAFAIIGLPDRALKESRERVRVAIVNSGFGFCRAGYLQIHLRQVQRINATALLAYEQKYDRTGFSWSTV